MPDNPPLVDHDFTFVSDADAWFSVTTSRVTLRDLFAAGALAGFLARNVARADAYGYVAEEAYKQADAMLAERERSR